MKPLKRVACLDGTAPPPEQGDRDDLDQIDLVAGQQAWERAGQQLRAGQPIAPSLRAAVEAAWRIPSLPELGPHGPRQQVAEVDWAGLGRATLDYAPAAMEDAAAWCLGTARWSLDLHQPRHKALLWSAVCLSARFLHPSDLRSPLISRFKDKPKPDASTSAGWVAWAQAPPGLFRIEAIEGDRAQLHPLVVASERWLPEGWVHLRDVGGLGGPPVVGGAVWGALVRVNDHFSVPGAVVFDRLPDLARLSDRMWWATAPWLLWRSDLPRAAAHRATAPAVLRGLLAEVVAAGAVA